MRIKNRGFPRARSNTFSATGTFLNANPDISGSGGFLDGSNRASLDAGGCGTMAAYGQPKKSFFPIFFNPNQRLLVLKGSLLLKGAGKFTSMTTRTDFLIDYNHHFLPYPSYA
jgi:hypothetical protein